MKTVVSLDEDVASAIESVRAKRETDFESVTNEIIRIGLRYFAPQQPVSAQTFQIEPVHLGDCLVPSLYEAWATLDEDDFKTLR